MMSATSTFTEGPEMDKRVVMGLIAVIGAGVAIEKFYKHPTYGSGLAAFFAVLSAGESF
jgi:hypothetical protein